LVEWRKDVPISKFVQNAVTAWETGPNIYLAKARLNADVFGLLWLKRMSLASIVRILSNAECSPNANAKRRTAAKSTQVWPSDVKPDRTTGITSGKKP
jgi:hypothetical protein